MNNLTSHIKELEERLLRLEVRKNPEILNELLGEEFEEIGSDGEVFTREQVIDSLVNREEGTTWSLSDFRIRELSSELLLATYTASKSSRSGSSQSIRSSLWKKQSDRWRMIFHQGTKMEDE